MKTHSIHSLTSEKPWLESIAHRLVHGDSSADDVVQETYLSALESPPDAARSTRGWLARVAKNAVRMSHRSDTRRQRREERVAAPLTFDGQRAIEEADARRHLTAAVRTLEEPYRSAILLRFVGELSIAGVAASQGIPEGTAGWRIHEGLRRLRSQLDERSGGDGRSMLMAALPAVRFPETSAVLATTTQGMTMTKLILIALALAASALGVAVASGSFDSETPSTASTPTSSATGADRPADAVPQHSGALVTPPDNSALTVVTRGDRDAHRVGTAARHAAREPVVKNVRYMIKADGSSAGAEHHAEIGNEAADLAHLLTGCFEDLARRRPAVYGSGGTASLDLELDGDEEVGSVVAMSEYIDKLSTIDDPEFKECVRESSFVLDGSPHLGGRAKISMTIDNAASTGAGGPDGIATCLDELQKRNPGTKLDGEISDQAFIDCISKHIEVGDELSKTCIESTTSDGNEDVEIRQIAGDGDCPPMAEGTGGHTKRVIIKHR